eukprot:gene11179-12353_t
MATLVETSTSAETITQEASTEQQSLVLHLKKPKSDKKVNWKEGTVDNENSGKRSSKCCCIYEKPKIFGESSSESDSSDNEDKCKAPKDYHKKSKKNEHDHEDCNCG